jgi:hypothetical protein
MEETRMGKQRGKTAGPGRLVKMCVDVPDDVNTRLYALAGRLGMPKRALAVKLLDLGMRRYDEDAATRRMLAALPRPDDESTGAAA